MSDNVEGDQRDAILKEADRIEENATFASQAKFEQAKVWRTVHLSLSCSAAATAAAAGATVIADSNATFVAGGLSLLSAMLAAVLGALNPGQRADRAGTTAAKFQSVQTSARQLRAVDGAFISIEDARKRLALATETLNEVREASTPDPKWAFSRAKQTIEHDGGQTHRVDSGG